MTVRKKFEEFKENEIVFGAKEFIGGMVVGIFIGFMLAIWILQ